MQNPGAQFREFILEGIRTVLGKPQPPALDDDVAPNGLLRLHARQRLVLTPGITEAQKAAIWAGEVRWRDALPRPDRPQYREEPKPKLLPVPIVEPVFVPVAAIKALDKPPDEVLCSPEQQQTVEAVDMKASTNPLRRLWARLRGR
jgi:hypothetical protein